MDLNSSLKSPGYPLSSVLFLSQHIRGRRFPAASAVQLSLQSPKRSHSQPAFILGGIQSSNFFSARARCSKSVSISKYSKLFTSHISGKKLVEFQHSYFWLWGMKYPKMVVSLCSICALASSTWKKSCPQDLASWTVDYYLRQVSFHRWGTTS